MNGSPLGDPEHIGTDLNVFWGKIKNKKKGMAFTKRVKRRSLQADEQAGVTRLSWRVSGR